MSEDHDADREADRDDRDEGADREDAPAEPAAEGAVLTISRTELFTKRVDKAVARARLVDGRPPEEHVSPVRRLLFSSLFYLPIAGLLGALGSHALVERYITDVRHVAGQIALVNGQPFDAPAGTIALTVGRDVVYVGPRCASSKGAHGEPPLSWQDLRVGAWIEAISPNELALERRTFQAVAIRPTTAEEAASVQSEADRSSILGFFALFPATAIAIVVALLGADGISRRNWGRTVQRGLVGGLLAALFSFVALIPVGLARSALESMGVISQNDGGPGFGTWRAFAWACVGAGVGFGMSLSRSTRAELRNSVVGGALGGAFGGLFFDPIANLRPSDFSDANVSRLVGTVVVGASIGLFVALLERMTREAWVRVRTGPLAGKSFVLYRSPTILGSAPADDIYLFKDAGISPRHASIHRVGQTYEIEDNGTENGIEVSGRKVTRHRLASGETITIGSTILEFEERAKAPVPVTTAATTGAP